MCAIYDFLFRHPIVNKPLRNPFCFFFLQKKKKRKKEKNKLKDNSESKRVGSAWLIVKHRESTLRYSAEVYGTIHVLIILYKSML